MGVGRVSPDEVVDPDELSGKRVVIPDNRRILGELSRGDATLIIRLNVAEAARKCDAVANPSTAAVFRSIFSTAGTRRRSNRVRSTNG